MTLQCSQESVEYPSLVCLEVDDLVSVLQVEVHVRQYLRFPLVQSRSTFAIGRLIVE